EIIITKDLRDRKTIMEERSDAFISLPGGFGTFEEFFEILTMKQLNFHNKPIVLLNTNGFYDKLFELIEYMYREEFAKEIYRKLYFIAPDVKSAISYIKDYKFSEPVMKWFDDINP
ncbi:MAG TPA: TIGR00730 family Rossman fold protein, partial [bacterium]|nr:TIGR00730 family Rossman fold protein [bacterium]